jgi:hypothetical protein
VGYVDRDPARFLFRRIVNRIVRPKLRFPKKLAVFCDGGRQGRLAMIDVPHRPYVQVRLIPLKLLLCHKTILLANKYKKNNFFTIRQ